MIINPKNKCKNAESRGGDSAKTEIVIQLLIMIGYSSNKKEPQDMLSQGNRFYLILIILISLSSCESDFEKKQGYYNYKLKGMKEDFDSSLVFALAKDSISRWVRGDLKYYHNLKRYEIKLDSQMYFNSKKDKCILSLLVRNTENEFQDMIYTILGERYMDSWWFYSGPTYVVIRKSYSADTQAALSFEKLKDVSRQNALNWYYVEKETGTSIKKLFSSGYSSYKECSKEEYLVNDQFFETELNVGMNPDPQKRIDWYLNVFLKSKYEE